MIRREAYPGQFNVKSYKLERGSSLRHNKLEGMQRVYMYQKSSRKKGETLY
jgi:hypothetical protein